ncbi:MAG: 4Fe-4S dicluster domain-containing protein [Planctomycetota bacterium]|jgi:formate dehydrogenase iron-sulfur subunit
MSHWGILTDVTKCVGCERCVEGCRESNETGRDRSWRWQERIDDLSASRWTTVDRLPGGRYVRRQCRHCLSPACASACPVGALTKTPEGAVVYDAAKCMGCRYCMMACPFGIPRYSWETPVPEVRKCVLCFERIAKGEIEEPACTAACPAGATVFSRDREELLREAHGRIEKDPGRYLARVWGETEAGGTGVLTISDVDIALPETVPDDPLPERTWGALKTVPFAFFGMGAAMLGLRWIIGRRNRLSEGGRP